MTNSIILVIEDSLSEAVARAMLSQIQFAYGIGAVRYLNKNQIQQEIKEINQRHFPCFVLTDQDRAETCPPGEINRLITGNVSPNLIYRFATMEVESWVMAHRNALSEFLGIPIGKIPMQTDNIPDPKELLIKLTQKYCRSDLRREMVPARNTTARIGHSYNLRLGEFVREHWRVRSAARNSPSLKRALQRLQQFQPNWTMAQAARRKRRR